MTIKEAIAEVYECVDIANRIPDMSIEELPEYLIHKSPLIRIRAKVKLEQLERQSELALRRIKDDCSPYRKVYRWLFR